MAWAVVGAEIRLRAERKAGQLLKQMPKAKGGQPSGKNRGPKGPGTLGSKGISKKQSKTWQKLATPTDEQFEAALGQASSNRSRLPCLIASSLYASSS